jgi:hypothetical protein
VRLEDNNLSALTKAACWVHWEFYNCNALIGSVWGMQQARSLIDCIHCPRT